MRTVSTSLVAACLGLACAAACAASERHPLQPADRSSPRATLRSFIEHSDATFAVLLDGEPTLANVAQRRRMIATVVGCLDLRDVAPSLQESMGRQAAVCLKEVLDRIELSPDDEIPDAAAADAAGLKRWRLPHTEITLVRVVDGAREGEWLFSPDTVARAESFYQQVRDLPYKATAGSPGFYEFYVRASGWMVPDAVVRALPAWARATVFEEAVWRWLALGILLAVAVIAVAATYRWSRRANNRRPASLAAHVLACLAPASVIMAGVVLDYLLTYQVRLTGGLLFSLKATLRVAEFAGCIMLVLGLLKHLADFVVHARGLRPDSIDMQLVRLGFKVVTFLVVAWIVIVGAGYLGISVAPLLAGLGVGGLAVALAAQHTVENLIAGLVLFADKPVRIGDTCRFGDVRGIVEQIGLRSTRVRCVDRTLVTIPNSEFAKLQLTNFSRRDRILFQTVLTLRYETSADQMRYLLADLRRMLLAHPRIDAESVRVRFTGYGEWALNVELFALAETTIWNEFMAIQEDVLLRVMDLVREAGCDFAFPSQTHYEATDTALDIGRVRRAEEAVAAWRRQDGLRGAGFLDVRPNAAEANVCPVPGVRRPGSAAA